MHELVSFAFGDDVSVIDTATNTVIDTINVGATPQGVAITPDGTRAYIADRAMDRVAVVDTATNTLLTTIPVGDGPQEVAVTPDGTRVYVTNLDSDDVSVIDTATNTVIDTATNTVVDTVPVGDGPVGVAIGTVTEERTPTRLTLRLEKKKGKDGKDALDVLGGGGRNGLTLKAKLTAEGEPLADKPIEFTTDSISLCTESTDSRGKATCKVPRSRADETCYTVTFAGDDTYEPSTATVCRFNGSSGEPSELEGPEGLSVIPGQALTPAAST
ncbi:YncE family protein [Streptomyces xantholiticus]|uniref:YncE family protein n=1 Tax=Streptomyces xantholiticus TaxID=68285 RepID=A0ABV1V4Q9_9ACTN